MRRMRAGGAHGGGGGCPSPGAAVQWFRRPAKRRQMPIELTVPGTALSGVNGLA